MLTLLLLPTLRSSASCGDNNDGARIINLSSQSHLHADVESLASNKYHKLFVDSVANRFRAYSNSKFLLVLSARRLRVLLANTGVSVHCVNPGNVETAIYRTFPPLSNWFLFALQAPIRFFAVRTPIEGAQSVLHALRSSARPFYVTNGTEHGTKDTDIHALTGDPQLTDQVWQHMEQLLAAYLRAEQQ